MKRYQEIEFAKDCKRLKTFLNNLQAKYPKFFAAWGEAIEYNMQYNQGCEDNQECGYILHTYCDDGYYYVCFIATSEQQVIAEDEEEPKDAETAVKCRETTSDPKPGQPVHAEIENTKRIEHQKTNSGYNTHAARVTDRKEWFELWLKDK